MSSRDLAKGRGSSSSIGKKSTGPLNPELYGDSNDLYVNSTANNLFQSVGGKDGMNIFGTNLRSNGTTADKTDLFLRDNAPSITKNMLNSKDSFNNIFPNSSRNQLNDLFGGPGEKGSSLSAFSRAPEKDIFSTNGPANFYSHPNTSLSRTCTASFVNDTTTLSNSNGQLRGDSVLGGIGTSQSNRLPGFPSVGQTSPNSRSTLGGGGGPGSNSSLQQVPQSIGSSVTADRSLYNHLRNSSGFTSPSRMSPNSMHMQQPPSYGFGSAANTKRGNSPSLSAFNSFPTNASSGRASSHSFGSVSPNLQSSNSLLIGSTQNSETSQQLNKFVDPQEFPALSQKHNSLGAMGSLVRQSYGGMASKIHGGEPNSEFTIQSEDFPALPGSVLGSKSRSMAYQAGALENFGSHSNDDSVFGGQAVSSFRGDKTEGTSFESSGKKGIQTSGDGLVTNIPRGMVTDQFGIVGLLTFIRAAERDSNLVALALGSDLQNLGLNLTSQDLFSTFQSPFAETPCRPQDIDFFVPSEYLTNLHIRDRLAAIKLSKYGEDTLFYLFYTNINDVLQLAAAAELYANDWRYHKTEKMWLTRAPGFSATKFDSYEQGTYLFFDPKQWRKVPREFRLEYDKLEDRPQLPTSLNYHPAHSQVH